MHWFQARRVANVLALALGGFVSISLALWLFFPQLTATQHLASGREGGRADQPWRFNETGKGHRLDVRIPSRLFGSGRWTIIPDDRLVSITIGGQPVPLDGVRPGGLTDWERGFEMDLSPWLHAGDNEVEFTIDNGGGPGGLRLRPLLGWRVIPLTAALLPWLFGLGLVFRLRRPVMAVLGAALLVLTLYWAATPCVVRDYDVLFRGETGHFDYVAYVAEHWELPRPDKGWEYYQPPPYYVGGALALRWADRLRLSEPDALQAYSLSLWLVFLTASAATFQRALGRSRWRTLLATAGLAFWPSSIIHSIRIGNDAALYATAAISTWLMFRWWRSGRRLHLVGMALAIAAALLSKSSAAALVAAAGALLVLRLLRKRRWRHLRRWGDSALAGAIVTIGVLLSVGRNVWYRLHGQVSSWLIVGTINAKLRVPNTWRSYVPLDVPAFLSSPWVDPWDDATGRTNFWNYLFRSALTGEFKFDGAWRADIAIVWGAVLLCLLLLLALRLHPLRIRKTVLWREAPWIMLAVAWVASLLVCRALSPYSSQGDFRFIVPVLVVFVLACVRRGRLAQALLSVIVLTSAAFFATL
jgi:hypothetical protein